MTARRSILTITTEVEVYPSSDIRDLLFSIPAEVLDALQRPSQVYVVVRDAHGNLIHHRLVTVVSGPEIEKKNFADQIKSGQLYPGQLLRLEVSRP
jgi:hypothetical protein